MRRKVTYLLSITIITWYSAVTVAKRTESIRKELTMKMNTRAITYDLNTKAMKADALTGSEVTAIYNQGKKVFEANGMNDHVQYSMYATKDTDDALKTIIKVVGELKTQAPDFCRYLSRFAIVHIDDSVDVTDLLRKDQDEQAA